MNEVLQGIPASPGMSIGKAYVLKDAKHLVPRKKIATKDIKSELSRFNEAVEKSRTQIKETLEHCVFDDDLKGIFEMQLLLLEDPMLIDETIEKIKNKKINSEQALIDEIANLKSFLLKSKNRVFQERVADLEDMGNRILSNLMGIPGGDIRIPILEGMPKDVILVAYDISPSLMLHIQNVAGIVVEKGAITGHMVILAKSRDIPCLVNVAGALDTIKDKDNLLLDAISGICVVNPDNSFKQTYDKFIQRKKSEKNQHIQSPVLMADKHKVELWTNLSDPESAQDIRIQGSSGVGLFRTEFLYIKEAGLINNPLKQKKIYSQILTELKNKTTTFRLLDISPEKSLPGQAIVKDRHLSGVQFLISNINITRMQIRSILEATIESRVSNSKLRLMIPMVSMIEEVEVMQNLCKDIRAEVSFDLNIDFKNMPEFELGVMLETPASIMMIPELNAISDFFSIGSNDLAHLILGLPRQNPYLTKEELFFQPSLYRMMNLISNQATKPVIICGEIASRIDIIPLLIGIGLDKLSMPATNLSSCAKLIQKIKYEDAQELAKKALQSKNAEELHQLLTSFVSKY